MDEEEEELMNEEPTEEQLSAAEKILKKLNFKYSPDSFHDFDHRRYIAMLEAIALNYDKVEEFDDDTGKFQRNFNKLKC